MVVIARENIQLVEPVPIEDDYCSGLALIQDVDGIGARFVLFIEQELFDTGTTVFQVKRKILLPYRAIGPGVEMTMAFTAKRAVTITGQRLLRLVKG
jgi:hypothetical protein